MLCRVAAVKCLPVHHHSEGYVLFPLGSLSQSLLFWKYNTVKPALVCVCVCVGGGGGGGGGWGANEKIGKRKVQGVPIKLQPFPDTNRKRKPTNPNKHKSIKRTKSTKISSLFPKRGNRSAKRTEKHKNKITQGKTYNKSPRRINHKAPKSKTNTRTTALERSVE